MLCIRMKLQISSRTNFVFRLLAYCNIIVCFFSSLSSISPPTSTATIIIANTDKTIHKLKWPFAAHRGMRTTTNYFLLNLSFADLLMSSLNCMFNFIYMLNSDWPFGSVHCSVNMFVGNITVASSVFTLVAISFNRYGLLFVWIITAVGFVLFFFFV